MQMVKLVAVVTMDLLLVVALVEALIQLVVETCSILSVDLIHVAVVTVNLPAVVLKENLVVLHWQNL